MTPQDFSAYFRALWGHDPFPWQARLAEQVCARDAWPDPLDLPTGSGKTTAIDIAVFWMAIDAARAPAARRAPRRVVLVVDRRVVVDQAFERAAQIAARLREAREGILHQVADRLRGLFDASDDDDPLLATVMRGGTVRDASWARRPDQPMVAASTVDQVGSRLLFRGYGVSPRARSIHAGLLGNDLLLLLDEVHLSGPFEETLRAIGSVRQRGDLPERFVVVRMSATTAGPAREPFRLDTADRSHPVLARRLAASKPAQRLEPIKVPANASAERGHEIVAEALAPHVQALLDAGLKRVAVIVNRVGAARAVAAAVSRHDPVLLTGRMRPLDKDAVVADLNARMAQGGPTVVVATQCIEAGADYDFDALITECASLDALRQRFGRLNRTGRDIASEGRVFIRSDAIGAEDPVYGTALAATWDWLGQREDLDFGIDALAPLVESTDLEPLLAPRAHAPVLLPATLDAWVQTHPAPFPDPDPALWLHGPQRGDADIGVVWRADVDEALLEAAGADDGARERLLALLQAVPPSALEVLPVPIWAVARWLRDEAGADPFDAPAATPDLERRRERGRLVAARRGDAWRVLHGDELRPGEQIVVPHGYGGVARGVWDPTSHEPVPDLGDRAQLVQRGRPVLRLHPAVWASSAALLAPPPQPSTSDEADPDEAFSALDAWLTARATDAAEPWLRAVAGRFARRAGGAYEPIPGGPGVLRARRPWDAATLRAKLGGGEATGSLAPDFDADDEEDGQSFLSSRVTLQTHSRDVEGWARRFATHCGLPPDLVDAVTLAGWLHDVGKADPRFQRLLCGGSAVRAALLPELLAKSDAPADRRSRQAAQRAANYPRGMRHELLSLALIEHHDALSTRAGAHWPLVLHLVASHHGWCRPWAPAIADPAPVDVSVTHGEHTLESRTDHRYARLDSGVIERFEELNQRYGRWGLAWLEAILRLADHRASEAPSEGGSHA